MRFDWVSHPGEIPQCLWERCFPPPLEGFWWYSTLDQCGIEDQFTFAYAVILRAGIRIGIAPTFLMDVPVDIVAPPLVTRTIKILATFSPRLMYQRTLFIGSPCSDEGTIGLVEGEDICDIVPALQRELDVRARQLNASMIVWKDLPDETNGKIGPSLLDRGLFSITSFPGYAAYVRGSSFEDYLKTLSSHQRYHLRKKLRQSRKIGSLEESIIRSPDDGC